jgi:hypothetical protein
MPSRVFHHKNRHGCFSCKRKRKKCNQQKPTCSGCVRSGFVCTYDNTPWQTTSLVSLHTHLGPNTTIDPSLHSIISLGLPEVDISDLELVYHYLYTDSETFDTIPGLFPVRQLNIAEKAREYPYLLYGLLAVSALHLQFSARSLPISKRLSYVDKAISHQQRALSSYISKLSSVDEKTCHSIFGFSVILAGTAFGFLRYPEPCHKLDAKTYVSKVISVFELLLGAVAVANTASAWISHCNTESLVVPIRKPLHFEDADIEVEVQNALRDLAPRIRAAQATECKRSPDWAAVDISVVYNSAIPELCNVFRHLGRSTPDNFRGVVGWAAVVDGSYTSLLKQGHPAALVVLAYYGKICCNGQWKDLDSLFGTSQTQATSIIQPLYLTKTVY